MHPHVQSIRFPSGRYKNTIHADAQHVHVLDGLRGVAAFAVMFLHGSALSDLSYLPHQASLAVDLFFMMSGFVLALAYDQKLATGVMTWRQFMTVRLIRLYPMILVGTIIGGGVLMLGELNRSGRYGFHGVLVVTALSLALLPAGFIFGAEAFPANNPLWSLFFEIWAGAIYATKIGRVGLRRHAALLIGLGVLLIVACTQWSGTYAQIGFESPKAFLIGFLRVSFSFCAGVLLFRLRHTNRLPRLPWPLIAISAAALLLGASTGMVLSLLKVLVLLPLLVALSVRASVGKVAAYLCTFAGELSYPLYVIHQPTFRVLRNIVSHFRFGTPKSLVLAVGIVVSILLAQIVLVFYDRPVRKYLSGRFRRV